MEPFNIRINSGSKPTTLTILPIEETADYKVIYNGAVLGGVRRSGSEWTAIPDEEITAGDLPLYAAKYGEDSADIKLGEETVNTIGKEIELAVELQ
jgi:hypothetical protein